MKKWLFPFAFTLMLLYLIMAPTAQGNMTFPPKPSANIYVQDFADLLTPETEARLLTIGNELNQKTTAQLAVVTVNSLGETSIEDYAIGLFRTWGIGSKDKNNGVLLLIAPNERQSRIEVGYGLEGALPDGKTGRIQDEYLIPKFQEGDFNGGISDCYLVLAGVIAEEYQVQLTGDTFVPVPRSENFPVSIPLWLIIAITLVVLSLIYLDFRFLGGMITWALLNSIRHGGRSGGSGRDGRGGFGGGSSGGGGSSRRW